MVANLRDRYARNASPPSPGPKNVPRLPLSVSNLATRYDSTPNPPLSPGRSGARSPIEDRRHYISEQPLQMPSPSTSPYHRGETSTEPFPATHNTGTSLAGAYDHALRQQRVDRSHEMSLREHEHQLRLREQEINLKAKELELERARLLHAQALRSDAFLNSDGRYSAPSRQLVDSPSSSPVLQPHRLQSQSSTSLATPSHNATYNTSSSSRSPISPSSSKPIDHAPSCGCESCSIAKYRTEGRSQPSPRDLRPPEQPFALRPEKPKGWIRRLSMPVINATFSSDSKKGISSTSFAANSGYRNSMAFPDEDGRIRSDGGRNRSSTNLSRR